MMLNHYPPGNTVFQGNVRTKIRQNEEQSNKTNAQTDNQIKQELIETVKSNDSFQFSNNKEGNIIIKGTFKDPDVKNRMTEIFRKLKILRPPLKNDFFKIIATPNHVQLKINEDLKANEGQKDQIVYDTNIDDYPGAYNNTTTSKQNFLAATTNLFYAISNKLIERHKAAVEVTNFAKQLLASQPLL